MLDKARFYFDNSTKMGLLSNTVISALSRIDLFKFEEEGGWKLINQTIATTDPRWIGENTVIKFSHWTDSAENLFGGIFLHQRIPHGYSGMEEWKTFEKRSERVRAGYPNEDRLIALVRTTAIDSLGDNCLLVMPLGINNAYHLLMEHYANVINS